MKLKIKIPEDWKTITVGQAGIVQSGFAFKSSKFLDNGKYQVIRIGNLYGGNLDLKRSPIFLNEVEEPQKSFVLNKDDLIFTMTGTMGKRDYGYVVQIADHKNLLLNQRVGRIIPNKQKTNPQYLFYICQIKAYLDQFFITATGGTGNQANVGVGDIRLIKIPSPPLADQKKIAEILGKWDEEIEKLENLIETKVKLKKGLMQQLLTGIKRFKEFEGQEWKKVKLGDLGETYSGLSGKSKDDFGSGTPYIPYLNIFNNSKIDITQFDYVEVGKDDKQNRVQYGDIFFTTSSETPHEVGMAAVLLDEIDTLYLNSFCFGFRLKDFKCLLPQYAPYCLRSAEVRKHIYKLAQGATRFNLSKKQLLKMRISLPLLNEQKKIALVLNAADKEIELLNNKLEALKNQKKGLMQKLLTGEIRVKV